MMSADYANYANYAGTGNTLNANQSVVWRLIVDRWTEWNGRFRDDVCAFVRGDPTLVPRLADRLMGSPDLYGAKPREPAQSINFVTCHDGFTLADLVRYDIQHNEANLDSNRDGSDHNLSWNCGAEGDASDPEALALRARQVKNLLAMTLLSLDTPMLLMGDEVGRRQRGNNNADCQDNEVSWFDWRDGARHAGLLRCVRGLIQVRFLRESVRSDHHLTLAELMSHAHVQRHGVRLAPPDHGQDSHSLAVTAGSLMGGLLMHFELPALPRWTQAGGWHRNIDTPLAAPLDVVAPEEGEPVIGPSTPCGRVR